MPKFRISVTLYRDLTPAEIKAEYGERMELDSGEDPVERFIEFLNDEGLDFFSEENMSDWNHSVDSKEVKKGE